MKPLFLRKKSAWYFLVITGILFVAIGLYQMTMSFGEHKGGAEGVALSPLTGSERSEEKDNNSGGLKSTSEEADAEAKNASGQPSEKEQKISEARQSDFFVEYRLDRDRTRSQQVDWLREIVNNQNSLEESKKEAQQRLLSITKTIETEMKLESLLKAENFKDAVAVTDENSVTIIVQVPILTTIDKNKIVEIASRITGFDEKHIKVIRKT